MIRIQGVEKAFRGRPVLRGVDLDVREGRVTAILGPNGSGKTTLIKMILGLVRPDAGVIEVGGQALNGDPAYRDAVGYMPQAARFPENLTGREILAMLDDLREDEVGRDRELVEAFALEPELDKPVRTLSGGNRQKVSATVAFLFDPALVILDEPTAGLDPVASGVLKDKVRRERANGKSVILTSHVLSEAEQLADDIAVLLDGRVLWAGAMGDLRGATQQTTLERAVATLITNHAVATEAA